MTERWLGLSDAAAALDETVADLERKVLHRQLPARQTHGGWQVLVEREAEQPDSAFLIAMNEMTHDVDDAAETPRETGALGMTLQATSAPITSPQTELPDTTNATAGTASMAGDSSTAFAHRASSGPPLKPPPPPRISDIPRPWMGLVAFFVLVLIAWLWLTIGSASITGRDEALKNALASHSTAPDAQSGPNDETPSWIIEYEEPAPTETFNRETDPTPSNSSSPSINAIDTAGNPDLTKTTQAKAIESLTETRLAVEPESFDESRFLAELSQGQAKPPRYGEWEDDALALGDAPRIKTLTVPDVLPSDTDRIEQADETQPKPTIFTETLTVNAVPTIAQPTQRLAEADPTHVDTPAPHDDSQNAARESLQPIAPTAAHWPSARTMTSASSTNHAADMQWTEQLGPPAQFVLMMSPIPHDNHENHTTDDTDNNEHNSEPTTTTTTRVKPRQAAHAQQDIARDRRTASQANENTKAASAHQAEIISIAGPPAVAAARVQQQAQQQAQQHAKVTPQQSVTRVTRVKQAAKQPAMHAPYYCPDCFD